MFAIRIVKAENVPDGGRWCLDVRDDPTLPRCSVQVKIAGRTFLTRQADPSLSPVFDDIFSLGSVKKKDVVHLALLANTGDCERTVGEAEIEAADLARRPTVALVLSDSNDRIVMDDIDRPCELHLDISEDGLPEGWPLPALSEYPEDATRAMIITRGTRGDVQPFVALARGLAQQLGWVVTICTELNCKSLVKTHSKVARGAIRFLPSGGNTPAHINTAVSRWAINSKSELMQAMMLARSEIEFFDSAPILLHWARRRRPHLLLYGFTLPNVAMMISELLRIPIIGFILQPSVIPSRDTVAVEAVDTHCLCCVDKIEEQLTGHNFQAFLKWSQENAPALGNINRLRARYDLPPLQHNSYEALQKRNMPIVIPINSFCFGPRPKDWGSNTVFTDFIFLRQEGEVMELNETFRQFIDLAQVAQAPIVLMAFSSMPVARAVILQMAVRIVEECAQMPRVIAMVGALQAAEPLKPELEDKVVQLKESSLLLEASSAPFGALFPHMSVLVIHGGLGTTAEALRSGHPTIVTGVLLMDQRFWGRRVAALRVGPEPVHIDHFRAVCVAQVEQCLTPACVERCRAVALQAQGRTADGVEENVLAIQRFFEQAPLPWTTVPEETCCKLRRDCGCMVS